MLFQTRLSQHGQKQNIFVCVLNAKESQVWKDKGE